MSNQTARSGPRILTALGIMTLLMSLLAIASPVAAVDGNIAVFKTMCESIGKQDVCNGRDDTLDTWKIDYTVQPVVGGTAQASVQTITVTLGDGAGGGGNTGGGSQGRAEGAPLPAGTYLVCEAPNGAPFAYKASQPNVLLDALPRPEPGGGGSSGGNQVQSGDCIQFDLGSGTEELKFLDQQLEPEGTGSIEILKTNNATPAAALAGAEFTVSGVAGTFVTAADGTFCVDGLEMDAVHTVTETKAPAGHNLASPTSQQVTVDVEGMCDKRGEAAADATFVNPVIVVIPPTPTLLVDKVANAETITINGNTAAPATITWTLTYTLTNGPVTGATITDTLPTGLTYIAGSASPVTGFSISADSRTLTWTFPTLSASGAVSFQTAVDVATISRTAATVNVATIDSTQTNPDTGQDSVTVSVAAPVLGGNPTPSPTPTPVVRQGTLASVPNTAMDLPAGGISVGLLALASLLGLGYVARRNQLSSRNRR